MSRRALIALIIGFFGIVIIGSLLYLFIPKASLLMSIAPEEATVTINGGVHQVKTGDRLTVAPGTLTITIARDGFDTYTEKRTIKNGENVEILQALTPKTDEARTLLQTTKSQAIIQRIAGNTMKTATDQLDKDYPILSILPIQEKYYSITTCKSQKYPNDTSKVAICVYLYDMEAQQMATDEVKQKGFDLNNYESYYVDATYTPQSAAGDD